ncbi:ribonuclease H-like domain-containing protein [Tanacetum coccineum]
MLTQMNTIDELLATLLAKLGVNETFNNAKSCGNPTMQTTTTMSSPIALHTNVNGLFAQNNDGTLSRYKARLVANGSTQLERVDVDETFSSVVKPGTIWTVLSLAASRHWPIHQLDVKNAFLLVVVTPPYLSTDKGTDTTYLLLYVDDIVLIASSEILAHMVNCNPSRTPIDTESKMGSDGDPVSDPTPYRSLADLVAYSDADWGGFPITRRSTLGSYVFLGNNLLSWSSKCQPTLSRSSAKAEYRGVANVVAQTCWLRNLLRELNTPLSSSMLVYCDNVSVVYLSYNPVLHQRTKHIKIDIHFCDLVAVGQVRVLHVPSRYQFADIFTKGLPSALLEEFRSSLSV